jgi:uncharacterized paraquat-inducible protein A
MSGTNHNPLVSFPGETSGPAEAPGIKTRTCYKCFFVLVDLTKANCPRCRVNLDQAERSARSLSALRTGRAYSTRRGVVRK